MDLNTAISHCKTMLNQHNGVHPNVFIDEEDEVIESVGLRTRTFSKFQVWTGPYGDQQIWAILVASRTSATASYSGGNLYITPVASPEEIGIILMDKSGDCRAMLASALDSYWKQNEHPKMFWKNQWAKAIHDVSYGISRTKPDIMYDTHGLSKVGDRVEIKYGPEKGSKGEILALMGYKNTMGSFNSKPVVLIGDTSVKSKFYYVSIDDIDTLLKSEESLDNSEEKEETEGEKMMRFFASSQHDPQNPWYEDPKNKRK